ncbi:MAG: hypothetical protein ACJ779_11450 [Chloroflexota bacterium]
MTADDAPIFTRADITAGMPARRASTLLYAIEARTALLASRARRAMARFETERTAAETEGQFLSALAGGRSLPLRPTIQDLDRHADRWASLVPEDPALRAEILRRIVEKYGLPVQARGLRAALGADDPVVDEAYRQRTGVEVSAAGVAPLPFRERLRWRRAAISRRLESLPPFWLAFTLTLTETVGAGVLALPIALAGFGPIGAALLLVVFGVLNVLTIAALVESITRDGQMRYGNAFLGHLIGDYLGRPGLAIAIPTLFVLDAVGFSVALIGFGSTLAGVTGVSVLIWAALLFAVVMAILWRGTLDATVAVAVAVGSVNILLLLIISIIAFANARPDAFAAGSGTGIAFDATFLELVFGVALVSYFGHTSAGHSARVVLARDPSGRHLLAGNVAAMLCAMAIYVVFVLVLTGAVGAETLIGYTGTALTPLAARVGPIIDVLGTIYIVLGVGLSAIYLGLGIFNQMADLMASVAGRDGGSSTVAGRLADYATRAAPLAVIFVVVEVLLSRGSVSFTEPLNVVGTLTLPLLSGVFPMLLLLAARRRGDRLPGRMIGPLGSPVVALAIGGVFLFGVVAFGLWIWDSQLERLAALAVGGAMIVLTVVSWRHGAFRPRTVVEYRLETGPPDRGILSVVSGGRAVPTSVDLDESTGRRQAHGAEIVINAPNRLRAMTVHLPADIAADVSLWVHSVGADGGTIRTPVDVRIDDDAPDTAFRVADQSASFFAVRSGGDPRRLTISLAPRSVSP